MVKRRHFRITHSIAVWVEIGYTQLPLENVLWVYIMEMLF